MSHVIGEQHTAECGIDAKAFWNGTVLVSSAPEEFTLCLTCVNKILEQSTEHNSC